jgi:hypothetical protein
MSAVMCRKAGEHQEDQVVITSPNDVRLREEAFDADAARESLRMSLNKKYEVLALLSRAFV